MRHVRERVRDDKFYYVIYLFPYICKYSTFTWVTRVVIYRAFCAMRVS